MYLDYAKGLNASSEVLSWVEKTLAAQLKKDTRPQGEVEHILDWAIRTNQQKMIRMSYAQAKAKAEAWTKAQQKRGRDIDETDKDVKVIKKFKDGSKIVRLIGQSAYKREGFLMRHCVGSYYGTDKEIYSYRDEKNNPHATFEVDKSGGQVMQVKGKGNGSIHPKYVRPVVTFLKHLGMEVREGEMQNLGYYQMGAEALKLAKEFCGEIPSIKLGGQRYVYAGGPQ